MSVREDLLRSARELYLAEGLAGFSLRRVADAAGVSATAIYRHWESKEDLLLSLCLHGHEIFARYLSRGLKGKTPRERLNLTGLAYLDFALEQRAYYLVMFVAPPEHLGFPKMVKKSDEEAGATFFMLVDRVRECVDAGVFTKRDPLELSLHIWAHVHGLVTIHGRTGEGGPPQIANEAEFRKFYARSVDALLDGLTSR